jgi:hypothetical protein
VRVFKVDSTFPQGLDPMQVWVKITDLPVGLRNREANAYLVHEFTTLLECDMSSLTRSDISWCRVLLKVADSEVVPIYQWIEYLKRSDMKKIFKIFFTVEQTLPQATPTGLGKRSTYWRPIEPGPKRFATGKSGGAGGSGVGGAFGTITSKGGGSVVGGPVIGGIGVSVLGGSATASGSFEGLDSGKASCSGEGDSGKVYGSGLGLWFGGFSSPSTTSPGCAGLLVFWGQLQFHWFLLWGLFLRTIWLIVGKG